VFEVTIRTDNPAVLVAIAKAVENTPPLGWNEGKPTDVNVHASLKSMKEAMDTVNAKADVLIKEDVIPAPTITPPVEPTATPAPPIDTKEVGQRLREALLAVSKMEGQTIQTAKEIAVNAVGGGVAVDKDFPNHARVEEAITALRQKAGLNG
jgi:hypothetical protein